ncbi:muscleblind-like protein 2a isoform X4 [Ostrea edulis]|uniref:muscleblind-like protein 2a isoform X4 n=1 Tax=Ostrea edulis TaxID=37623 RepID=UPI0024AE9D4A|nr:muscleblind-like protein 2a isoform X4 [Ostrea edulis]XP_056006080.1 muscleblind-like protein 2a isoform X4 [Ostrea edulis]XP_056006081.1 muscleblind-like protein 2a isoform X4 [Ostrea edulis]XP_056006082.1 muscleblind-like protein 2a isoform X4 [Ostrea edulis]XP_056006083.1 muscleblind-like protein 2a isoform X4 [Ostrea edulis]XP_056006084.1 muscleblind-like protein 2a isoform X4 [Ostrea edulis]
MAMVNSLLAIGSNVKDSRWLTLEVCREYQRNKCTRTDTECKFAHPPAHVEVQNGRVTACFDSIKGKCQRKDPPCKYLHPPQHLREQLLQNGRNNLILKNLQMQAAAAQTLMPSAGMVPGMMPTIIPDRAYGWSGGVLTNGHPYLAGSVPTPTSISYNPYVGMQTVSVTPPSVSESASQPISGVIQAATSIAQNKLTRPDRLEVCREFQRGSCTRQPSECRYAHPPDNVTVETCENQVTVCMDFIKGKCTRDSCKYFHPPPHLQAQIKAAQQRANSSAAHALPQVVEVITSKKRPREIADDLVLQSPVSQVIPYKRVAMADGKTGLPMYQPGVNPLMFQQHMAMPFQQGGFFPGTVAFKSAPQTTVYPGGSPSPALSLQQQYVPVSMPLVLPPAVPEAVVTAPAAASLIPTNAHNVNYFDSNQQVTCARLCVCSHGNHFTVVQKAKHVYGSFDMICQRRSPKKKWK